LIVFVKPNVTGVEREKTMKNYGILIYGVNGMGCIFAKIVMIKK